MDQKIGGFAFIAGVLIALLGGTMSGLGMAEPGWIIVVLVILGLIVGFMNVSDKEITAFLIAAIALLSINSATSDKEKISNSLDLLLPNLGKVIVNITNHIAAFVAPAALIAALTEVYKIASTPEGIKTGKGK
ncbi:MAG: hypothetical protein N3F05_04270 [Candidatus Diapherotrites archaeon]|nr:hypothetical protein [Candidatus Diapherotrites archaeon]